MPFISLVCTLLICESRKPPLHTHLSARLVTEPTAALPGYYTVSASIYQGMVEALDRQNTTRTAQILCEPGYHCAAGVKYSVSALLQQVHLASSCMCSHRTMQSLHLRRYLRA